MRNLYKSVVPILLAISMVLTMGVGILPADEEAGNDQDPQIVNETPAPTETPPEAPKEEAPKVLEGEEDKDQDVIKGSEDEEGQDVTEGPKDEEGQEVTEAPKDQEDQVVEEVIEDEENQEDKEDAEVTEDANATLKVNHLRKLEDELDEEYKNFETEVIEGLVAASVVDISTYIKISEELEFLKSDPSELSLVEGENELNLYYVFNDNIEDDIYDDGIGEAPDFLPGEEVVEALPSIQTFRPGEFGPFPKKPEPLRRTFGLMAAGDPQVKNPAVTTYGDEINNKEWPNPGSLQLNKTGVRVEGSGNQFEVKLEIEGKNKMETSDIVLVIDRSGSMSSGGRMTNAKTAANNFVDKMFDGPNSANTRIALVSFSGDVTTYEPTGGPFVSSGGRTNLKAAINNLSANGGTHIQAGIRQGIAVLTGSSADNKTIVFLGDGGATYSYKPTNPNNYLEPWKTSGGINYYRTTSAIPQSGFDYGTRVGSGSNEYQEYAEDGYYSGWLFPTWNKTDSYNYRHGAHAVAEAGFAPADQNIYTIALGAGTEGEWTLNAMQNSGYYSTPDPTNLTAIYNDIAGSIGKAARDAVVTDPLGDMYDILGINASNYNSLITVSHGTLAWDVATESITWNIGTISEGTTYTMKYKVNLDYSAEGGEWYPANKPTYISYKNIDEAQGKKYFPIPEFRLREITLTKILTNGKPEDANKTFDITLEGPVGPYKKTWTVSLKAGESKKIKGLLPGDYTIKETVPMNFQLVSGAGAINIGDEAWKTSRTVTNNRNNDGWFWDDPDPTINSFTVAGTKRTPTLPTTETAQIKLDYFVVPSTLEEDYKLVQA